MGLGPYRGRPVLKLGTSLAHHVASAYARVEDAGWLCARLDGFDLHGRVAFGAADRKRLEGARALLRQARARVAGRPM